MNMLHFITNICPYLTGKGIPNHFSEPGCKRRISPDLLPHATEAADLYRQHFGSVLTVHSTFELDPFKTEQYKLRTEIHFAEQYPDISHLFFRAANSDYETFKEALFHLINLTKRNV